MYEYGDGVKQDYVEALKWWRKAAEQQDLASRLKLAQKYEAGLGVKQDLEEAYFWYSLCPPDLGQADNKKAQIAAHFTPDQKKALDQRVREWQGWKPGPVP